MPENDQCRWIGIRPTNPAENIPVDVQALPACNKVEPCAANNHFNVDTQKITPAIADIQAPSDIFYWYEEHTKVGDGEYIGYTAAVPADKILVVTNITAYDYHTALTAIAHNLYLVAVLKGILNMIRNPGISVPLISSGIILIQEGYRIGCRYVGCANGDALRSTVAGYYIDKY